MAKPSIRELYYLTHVNNLPSILKQGILSHTLVATRRVEFTPIYDSQIVSNRSLRSTPDSRSLWDYANLYFQPRNPMLYRVINEKGKNDIAILGIRPDVLQISGAFVATGNAASSPSEILPVKEGIQEIHKLWKVINNEWWTEEDGSKRKIMAECLLPDSVAPEFINTIYVTSQTTVETVKQLIKPSKVPVVPEPRMFFQPIRQIRITNLLNLAEGDLFFSQRQTLTISVNTVGIMGKGLASRAKYQFPDVYVFYQDLCRRRTLRMGKPYIYKRESSLDTELAAEPPTEPEPNSTKWFLLFPTKKHWRENSDINGIEEGLQWVKDNYKHEGVQSLAVPALGCGLGGLDWRDVGPLICQYLSELEIPVTVYLPGEQKLAPETLSPSFLLGKVT